MSLDVSNTHSPSDEMLIERINAEDVEAFSMLYDRYSPVLYGLCIRILKDPTKSEDVLQEVFLKIWRNAAQFNNLRGNPKAWMIIICRNMCIDHLRAMRGIEKKSVEMKEGYARHENITATDNPVEKVTHQEMHAVVCKALDALPAEQKLIIELAYFQGLSQSELAKQLDLPLGTVKTRMRLAMKKLREKLISIPDYKDFTK